MPRILPVSSGPVDVVLVFMGGCNNAYSKFVCVLPGQLRVLWNRVWHVSWEVMQVDGVILIQRTRS